MNQRHIIYMLLLLALPLCGEAGARPWRMGGRTRGVGEVVKPTSPEAKIPYGLSASEQRAWDAAVELTADDKATVGVVEEVGEEHGISMCPGAPEAFYCATAPDPLNQQELIWEVYTYAENDLTGTVVARSDGFKAPESPIRVEVVPTVDPAQDAKRYVKVTWIADEDAEQAKAEAAPAVARASKERFYSLRVRQVGKHGEFSDCKGATVDVAKVLMLPSDEVFLPVEKLYCPGSGGYELNLTALKEQQDVMQVRYFDANLQPAPGYADPGPDGQGLAQPNVDGQEVWVINDSREVKLRFYSEDTGCRYSVMRVGEAVPPRVRLVSDSESSVGGVQYATKKDRLRIDSEVESEHMPDAWPSGKPLPYVWSSSKEKPEWSLSYRMDEPSSNRFIMVNGTDSHQIISLVVTDTVGCRGDAALELKNFDLHGLRVPAAFTPNGDGVNDVWVIPAPPLGNRGMVTPEAVKVLDVEVYDRWGIQVFKRGENYREDPWDGKDLKGHALPMDSYHYELKLNVHDEIRVMRGTVTIVR